MPKSTNTRIVQYSAEKIYHAVLDIASYPRILPFIRSISLLEKQENHIKARVYVGLPMLNFSYDCLIRFQATDSITIELLSGPFKKLYAEWTFEPIDENSCKVAYILDSEFKNPLMEMTAGAIFASQLNHSMKLFEASLKRS